MSIVCLSGLACAGFMLGYMLGYLFRKETWR
jgi:hypothetical protein